ncbi:MAG TPA: alpha/beta fold hydrolase [Longimicrobiales bacterium]|nr:alpha/beta fold hydrolase [Longimicrobiales bacterium]
MTRRMRAASMSLAVRCRKGSHVLTIGVAIATAAACFDPAAAHAQSSVRPGTFSVRGEDVSAEYGELEVRANRASGTDAVLTLRFVRFASTAAEPRPPIVFLAGGPGDAATRALSGMPREVLEQLRAVADVIAFDQRGTGTSEPSDPTCGASPMLPRDRAGDAEHLLSILRPFVAACIAAAPSRGIDIGGLTTVESADDVEALRQALGAPSLQLLAGSYGTHLALAVARRHPESVTAMVLAGVEGPDHTFKRPVLADSVLAGIAAAKRPTLLQEIATLRARLMEPVAYTFANGRTITLGAWDLQRWVAESLDAMPEIAAMMSAMPRLLDGDYEPLAVWTLRARLPQPFNLMNLAMDCASYASDERLRLIGNEGRTALLGDALNFPKPALCDLSGLPRLDDTFRQPVSSNTSALLVTGEWDGRTPPANAREVARRMPNAHVLVIENASHGVLGHPDVLRRSIELFRGAK